MLPLFFVVLYYNCTKVKIYFSVFVSNNDSLDWKEYGVQHQVNQVLNHKHLGNGSIMLFHNDAEYTPDSLDTILKGLKEKGYEVVPVGELIHKDNYYMEVADIIRLN